MKKKQSLKRILDNNIFVLKICFSAAPLYIITYIIEIIRNELFIFIEHTYGISYVLDAVEFGKPFKNVAIFLIVLFILLCLSMLFNAWMFQLVAQKGLPKMKQQLKCRLYEKAKSIDLECYDNPEYYNNFMLSLSEADKQVERMLQFLEKIFGGITIFITIGAYFLITDATSVIFSIISFTCTFGLIQVINKMNFKIRLAKNVHERKRDYVNRVFYLNDYAKELRLNADVSSRIFKEFKQANDSIYNIDKFYAKKKFLLDFAQEYLCNDFISDVIYIGYLIFKVVVLNAITYSTMVILYTSSGRLKRSLRLLTEIYPYASETSLYVEKIRNFLEYEAHVVSRMNINVPNKPKKIEFSHVSFSYDGEGDIIQDLSMTINPGEKVALVGYNGAGKTTLTKLIMRLYDVKSGTIKLDGRNIKDYDIKQYHNRIGTVFQDFKLYAATLKENVVMDNAEFVSDKLVLNALSESGFKERYESLKDGLDTNLTAEFQDHGINLSGGESQKVAIARAFFKDSSLIILDEPSSALDPIAEYELNHSIMEATKDKTVIFISHRLSTTRLADKILMLENGKIIECGNHNELLKLDGKYAEMWRVQAGQYLQIG